MWGPQWGGSTFFTHVSEHTCWWPPLLVPRNKEAIQVNQAWAGHPGSQVLAAQGNNSLVEVWTRDTALGPSQL